LSISQKIIGCSALFSGFYSDIQFLAELSRRGTFQNVAALTAAIKNYIDVHNQNPHVFVWTASVERILMKIIKCKETLDALH
jgi:hypothetical protein